MSDPIVEMTEPGIVEKYWTGVASQLQVEASIFGRLIGHNGEMGRANELALTQLIASLMPDTVGVGTGIVIDSQGNRSSQTDLILYERGSQPQLLAHSTQLLFPVETVLAVVEVKTSVATADIHDSARKFSSVRTLHPRGRALPLTVFFGYSAANAPSVRAQELNALTGDERPDVACILDPGVVSSQGTDSLQMGMVPLHATGPAGDRLSRQWIRGDRLGPVIRGGMSYPVASLQLYGEQVLFEPGRALLLFAEHLLSVLADRTGWNLGWLTAYVTPIARETVIPPTR